MTRLWILSDLHLEAVLRGFVLADKGHDLRLIQDYLDHRDPRRTAHYTRTFEGLRSR